MNELVPRTGALAETVPAILQRAGRNAVFAADEFFSARLSNSHTRRAYARPVRRFLTWCEAQGIELHQGTPGIAGRFLEELLGSDPTRNLALAALRHFFDALVMGHAVALNPFASVRGKKHVVVDGKTPELTPGQARALLGSLDLSRVVGLRDRAVLGVLTYTGARVGALAQLRCGDLEQQESQRVLRFAEKGGKQREIPVRYDLDGWIVAYSDPKDLTKLARDIIADEDRLHAPQQSASARVRVGPQTRLTYSFPRPQARPGRLQRFCNPPALGQRCRGRISRSSVREPLRQNLQHESDQKADQAQRCKFSR